MADTRIEKVRSELANPLNTDNGHLLMEQLAVAESYVGLISVLKRNAGQRLLEARQEHLPPKDKSITELDRKTTLEALTASEERTHGILEDLEKKLYNRISLGQTMLKSMQEELKRQL